MPDAEVRAGIVGYLNAGNLTGITHWYQDLPWMIQGDEWHLNVNGGWGALGYVHIDDAQESRVTDPFEFGNKQINYVVSLVIMYRYLIPTSITAGSEDAWVNPLDQIIGDTKALIRADQTAGTGGNPIWQWGQTRNGIRHQRDLPKRLKGAIQSWNRLEVDVTEIITA